ncbi:TagK domain-containing protein [Caballeronia sp. LjRoot34]|uniref:TagK domain-containing protein n=1 Tax=Caballeronia sp. LjRoot34 TaxID=3342325 RepID=UPI003ECE2C74
MSDWLSPERKRINEIIKTTRKTEPKIIQAARIAQRSPIDARSSSCPDHEASSNAIFDLIGTVGNASHREPAKVGANDVIGSLYDQYCRALDDPQAVFSGDWSAPAAIEHASLSDPKPLSRERTESIETILCGMRGIEMVFGKLEKENSPPAAIVEPVPEILQLFAPPEFKARGPRLPSALVRREHHASGIDSPLLAPHVLSESKAVI